MVNKGMKRCSTSSVIMEMQIKTTVRHHFIPNGQLESKRQTITSISKDVEKSEPSDFAGGMSNGAAPGLLHLQPSPSQPMAPPSPGCSGQKPWGLGASLVAQWLRICLPMQGTRVRALVWEDPTCRGATKPVSHKY